MTSTDQLEKYRDYALTDIRELVSCTDERIDRFIQILQNFEDNITSESRHNKSALITANEDLPEFFNDMIYKVQSYKDKLFVKDGDQIMFRPYGIEIKEDGDIYQAYTFRLFESLNSVIAIFERRKSSESSTQVPSSQRTTKYQSFTLRNQDCLNDLYSQMVHFGYIDNVETNKKNFVHAFKGIKVDPPIVWNGDIQDLRYFVINLVEEDLIFPLGKDHWLVACKSFVKNDRSNFTTEQLRTAHQPPDPNNIDSLLSTIRSA